MKQVLIKLSTWIQNLSSKQQNELLQDLLYLIVKTFFDVSKDSLCRSMFGDFLQIFKFKEKEWKVDSRVNDLIKYNRESTNY